MAGIDTFIFVTGRNKRAIDVQFDGNQELEAAFLARACNIELMPWKPLHSAHF